MVSKEKVRLCERALSLLNLTGGHKGLQLVHSEVTLRCLTYTLHQLQHLIESNAVDRQQNRVVDQQRWVDARQIAESYEQDIGNDVAYPERDHRLHRICCQGDNRRNIAEEFCK